MRALMVLVVGMGVLIVAGVAVVAVTIIHRMGGPARPLARLLLDEPAGTHIAGVAAYGDGLALVLQGGGADRVIVVDVKRGTHATAVQLGR